MVRIADRIRRRALFEASCGETLVEVIAVPELGC